MSSFTAPRCRHIKVSGAQCGSPALRNNNFCFYHKDRPIYAECYSDIQYATGEIVLPAFEDAHSIQAVLRQTVQMLLQKRIEKKTATLILYAMQIASSNLKRMEQEKPQPEQVVTDVVKEERIPNLIAAPPEVKEETKEEVPQTAIEHINKNKNEEDNNLPPGTIQACYRPRPPHRKQRERESIH